MSIISRRTIALAVGILVVISGFDLWLSSPDEAYALSADSDQFIAFTSDVHNISGTPDNVSSDRLGAWIDTMKGKYDISYMGFCGDMADGRSGSTQADFWIHAETAINMALSKGISMCFTTGNHEYDPGKFTPGLNSTTAMYTVDAAPGNEPQGANYHIYCLGASSKNAEYTSGQISSLSSYLNGINDGKPIFVITHHPLHYFVYKSGWYTDTRQTTNADSVIETLNSAVTNGTENDTSDDRTIVFLWGHNHTHADSVEGHYDQIFQPGYSIEYSSGQSKTTKFYYAAAGCMSDSEYSSGSNSVRGKGLVVQIRPEKNSGYRLGFGYFNVSGSDVTSGGMTITDEPPAHDHDLSKTEATPASCTEAGNSAYWTCSICGRFFNDETGEHQVTKDSWVIDMLPHDLTKTEAVAATCTTGGNSAYWTCNNCGRYFSNAAGTKSILKDSWIINQYGHNLIKTEAKAATCTAAGNTAYWSCNRTGCGKYFSDAAGENEIEKDSWVIAKLDHDLSKTEASPATCTATGNSEYWTCSLCKRFFSDSEGEHQIANNSWVINKLDHDLTKTEAVAATCTTGGNSAYWTCGSCGGFFSNAAGTKSITEGSWIINKLGHNMSKTEAKPATCTSAGNSAYWTCSRTGCGKYFSDASGEHEIAEGSWVIDKLDHDLKKTEAASATCTSDGNIEYWSCESCGKYFSDSLGKDEISKADTVINELGHDYKVINGTAKAPTCTEDGKEADQKCSRCDSEIQGAVINKLGHDWDYGHIIWDWAEDNGSAKAALTCRNDDTHSEEIAATVTTETSDKIITHTAKIRGFDGREYKDVKTIYVAHTHTPEHHEAVPATCTEGGSSEYWSCESCGGYFSDEACEHEIDENSWIVDKLGHDLTKTKAVDATCTEAGNSEYWSCGRCGKFFSDEKCEHEIDKDSWIVDKLGHDYVVDEGTAKASTCTEDGKEADQKCSRCDSVIEGARIEKLAHDWDYEHITWKWADDSSSAKAILKCKNDDSHNEEIIAAVTSETSGTGGALVTSVTYTAIIKDGDGKEYKDTKTVIVVHKHLPEHHEALTASCTSDGNNEFWACSGCGKFFSDEVCEHEIEAGSWNIPASGHESGSEQLTRKAATTNSGILSTVCGKCGEEYDAAAIAPVIAKAKVNSSTKATITWRKVSGAQRYRVYLEKCSKNKFTFVKNTTGLKYIGKGLSKSTPYRFKVLAQRKINGKWTTISTGYIGYFISGNLSKNKKYTNPKSITATPAAVALAAGETSDIKASVAMVKKNKKLLGKSYAARYRYLSTDTDVATVNSKGRITAVAPGTCTIYVVGINGISRGVQVTVE